MGIRHRQWDLEGVQFHPKVFLANKDINCWLIFCIADSDCHLVIFYAYFVIIISYLLCVTG